MIGIWFFNGSMFLAAGCSGCDKFLWINASSFDGWMDYVSEFSESHWRHMNEEIKLCPLCRDPVHDYKQHYIGCYKILFHVIRGPE